MILKGLTIGRLHVDPQVPLSGNGIGASRALSSIGITDIYLQGLGVAKSQEAVYTAPVPSIPATALLALGAVKKKGAA